MYPVITRVNTIFHVQNFVSNSHIHKQTYQKRFQSLLRNNLLLIFIT